MFKNEKYQSVICDKPTSGGEPKTDIFCQATNSRNNIKKFKISFKLDDAAFPQNKITAKIARQLGITQEIINAAINLREEFVDPSKPQKRGLLHFERPSCGRGQEKNSRKITMGWKCEANTKSRGLSIEITGNDRTRMLSSMYLGTNQEDDKRNAHVNGERIIDSGIPNFMLQTTLDDLTNVQSIFDNLETVDDYINSRPTLFIIFTGLNYFIDDGYFEQKRELWVWPEWYVENNLLCVKMRSDEIRIALDVEQNFFDCILEMGIDPETFELDQIRDRIHPDVIIHDP